MDRLIDTFFCLFILFIIGSIASVDSRRSARIVNKKFSSKGHDQIHSPSAHSGEVLYEDESEFQNDEDFNDPWLPPPPPPPQILSGHGADHDYSSNVKRYGNKMFGDDFALFLVLLTIAGFFGLIISMLMPFTFILANGGVTPLTIGGINGFGLNGINGLAGVNGINGINGINGGFIGRKKRSVTNLTRKSIDLLALLDIALERYSTNI